MLHSRRDWSRVCAFGQAMTEDSAEKNDMICQDHIRVHQTTSAAILHHTSVKIRYMAYLWRL
jgi:hypothetical protein